MQALRFSYYPGQPRPNPETCSPRALLLWERGKREFEEAAARRKMQEEAYASRRGPETLDDFRHQEADTAARRERERRLEAEAEADADRAEQEERERRTRQAARAQECYVFYWQASTPKERGIWLYEFAKAIGVLREMDAGFHNQTEVGRAIQALNDVNRCPASFVSQYKTIRGLTPPPAPQLTPEQRMSYARTQLLGL